MSYRYGFDLETDIKCQCMAISMQPVPLKVFAVIPSNSELAKVCGCYRSVVCPVCLSVLSVTFVHCGQTVGRIKMKLGMQVGLGPGHIVSDWDPAPPPQRGHAPQFSAHICCGQMTPWIKMSLGMELGLGPRDFVLHGTGTGSGG